MSAALERRKRLRPLLAAELEQIRADICAKHTFLQKAYRAESGINPRMVNGLPERIRELEAAKKALETRIEEFSEIYDYLF